MIEIVETRYGLAPFIICDVCQEPITDASLALAAMRKGRMNEHGRREVFHVHKDKCFPIIESSWSQLVDSVELTRHLDLLIQNAGVSLGDLREERDSYGKAGL